MVWALPISLATTLGIVVLLSFPMGTKMFQFPTFPSIYYFTHIQIYSLFLLYEFPHSDIHGFNGYLLLPVAFRSLSRPSSALGAQAFTLRSLQLNLFFQVYFSLLINLQCLTLPLYYISGSIVILLSLIMNIQFTLIFFLFSIYFSMCLLTFI